METEFGPPTYDISPAVRRSMLINEVKRWLNIPEVGGNNRGQLVEIFQKSSGIPPGSPWCMAFVQYCIAAVDGVALLFNPITKTAMLRRSAHCMTTWRDSPLAIRSAVPTVGSIAIWKHAGSDAGHTGVVVAVDLPEFKTIEGNTGPAKGIQREGDGVYLKTHTINPTGSMSLVGFISPWGK